MIRFGIVIFLFLNINGFSQSNKAIKILNEAVTLLNKGSYSLAFRKFSEGIKADKKMPEMHFGKANAAFNLNLFDTANTEVEIAIALDGPESKYYDLKGNINFHRGEYAQAIENFDLAIKNALISKTKINLINTYYNRGSCYLYLKNYKVALVDFSKVIDENKQFREAYHNRGICYIRLNNISRACEDMHKAVSLGSPLSQKYIDEYCYE